METHHFKTIVNNKPNAGPIAASLKAFFGKPECTDTFENRRNRINRGREQERKRVSKRNFLIRNRESIAESAK